MPLANAGITALEIVRKRGGLTGRELASAVGVHPSYISQIERGWRRPSRRLEERFSDYLDTPVEVLFPAASDDERTLRSTKRRRVEARR